MSNLWVITHINMKLSVSVSEIIAIALFRATSEELRDAKRSDGYIKTVNETKIYLK